jgi:peptidoglycan/LPS O-acetylase OafA/YrhL
MVATLQRFIVEPFIAGGIFVFVLLGCATLVFFCKRLGGVFAQVVDPRSGKLGQVEGLRGILALSVVAHHAYCWYFFTQTALWGTRDSIVFARLATFGVMQFFFISGFLFWRKLMKKGGIDLRDFYLARFVRLGPVYYVSVTVAILVGLSLTNFQLIVSTRDFLKSLVSWGLFAMGGQNAVNGADVERIISGVVWTLGFEWCFYLALPFLGWFARHARRLVPLALICGAVWFICKHLNSTVIHNDTANAAVMWLRGFSRFMLMGFGGGILVASVDAWLSSRVRLPIRTRSWIVAAMYGIYLLVPGFPGFQVITWLCMLIGFAMVVQGSDLFGFLTSRSVRFLGVISYDLYLVHGIVYFLAWKLRGGVHPISPLTYMLQTSACLAVILVVATLLHFAVERPTMIYSERIMRGKPDKRGIAPVVLPQA